jgi:hypothetical protein
MEFSVNLSAPLPGDARLAALLETEDPAAVGELDQAAQLWRVNTVLTALDLVDLLARAGSPTPLSRVQRLPSVCCGGCGG